MKKLAVIALMIGVGAVPAFADATYNFTYTSPVETAIGTLIGNELGNTGDYQITSGTISITGSAFSGTGVIATNPSDLAPFGADNVLYFVGNGPNGRYLDVGGLLFSTTNGLNNLWGVITMAMAQVIPSPVEMAITLTTQALSLYPKFRTAARR